MSAPEVLRPWVPVGDVRRYFESREKAHLALVVGIDGTLLTTIDHADLAQVEVADLPAARIGTLSGRVVGPNQPVSSSSAWTLSGSCDSR